MTLLHVFEKRTQSSKLNIAFATKPSCFSSVIGGAVPVFILTLSIIFGVKATLPKFKSLSNGQPLLATHASGSTQYGTLHTDDSTSTSSEEQHEPLPRWSLYNVTRLAASALQVTLFSYALVTLINGAYDLDPAIEPNRSQILVAFTAQIFCWVKAFFGSQKHIKSY